MLRKKGHDASRTAAAAVSSRVFVIGLRADVVDRVTGDEGPGLQPAHATAVHDDARQQQRPGNRSVHGNAPAVALRRQSAQQAGRVGHGLASVRGTRRRRRGGSHQSRHVHRRSPVFTGRRRLLRAAAAARPRGSARQSERAGRRAEAWRLERDTRRRDLRIRRAAANGDHGLLYRDRDRVLGNAVPAVWIRRFQQHLRIQSPRGRRVRGHAPRLGLESLSGLLHRYQVRCGPDVRQRRPGHRSRRATPAGNVSSRRPVSRAGGPELGERSRSTSSPRRSATTRRSSCDVSTRRRSSRPTRTRSRAWWRPPRTPRSRAS